MISTHWIPDHRGPEDKERFAWWKPPFVKIVCVDEKPPYTEDVPADSKIVVRNHPMSENYGVRSLPNPATTGTEHAAACKRMADYLAGKGVPASRLLFEGLNEPQVWNEAESPAKVAAYYKAFLLGLHSYGLHGVVGNFGVGWPGNGGVADAPPQWDFFKPVIDVMQPGDCLGLHEYWSLSGPEQNWRWWAGRFLQCPYNVPILITECGIDTGVSGTPYGGWRDLPGTMDEKAARYVNELWRYADACSKDARVQGIFPFTYDMSGPDWQKFNIRDNTFMEQFKLKLAVSGMPQPGGNVMAMTQEQIAAVRTAGWNQLKIPYNPDAAFAKYARQHGMGNPVTPEYQTSGCSAQGFAGGITACPTGKWDQIELIPW
jgi:hypothetical protein